MNAFDIILWLLVIIRLNHILAMDNDTDSFIITEKTFFSDKQILNLLNNLYLTKKNLTSNSKEVTDEYFWLYTRTTVSPQYLRVGSDLSKTEFGLNKKTWFIIHGWLGSGEGENVQRMKNAFLTRWDVNVIVLNWHRGAYLNYILARWNMKSVSIAGCLFLKYLEEKNYPMGQINIVGHSLGAHISGIMGKCVGERKLGSITGLDPANPLFSLRDSSNRLAQNDAQYVEVLHSNAGFMGFVYPIGNTDVYVNGGTRQPECELEVILCPHTITASVYIYTIENANKYVASKCDELNDARSGNCHNSNVTLIVGGDLPKTWVDGMYWFSTVG